MDQPHELVHTSDGHVARKLEKPIRVLALRTTEF